MPFNLAELLDSLIIAVALMVDSSLNEHGIHMDAGVSKIKM